MAKPNRKLTKEEKRVKKQRTLEYETVFMNGKQVRVKRPPTIDGMSEDEFIARNADPIWLHQNGLWEKMEPISEPILKPDSEPVSDSEREPASEPKSPPPKLPPVDDIPF